MFVQNKQLQKVIIIREDPAIPQHYIAVQIRRIESIVRMLLVTVCSQSCITSDKVRHWKCFVGSSWSKIVTFTWVEFLRFVEPSPKTHYEIIRCKLIT